MNWLPKTIAWDDEFRRIQNEASAEKKWGMLLALAKHDLDIFQVAKLDRLLDKLADSQAIKSYASRHLRIALLGTGTLNHLAGAIRVACLRRNIYVDVLVGGYNLFQSELRDRTSAVWNFSPNIVLLSIDARYAFQMANGDVSRTLSELRNIWSIVQSDMGATVIQQKFLPIFPDILGNSEHHLPSSPQSFISNLNREILPVGDETGVLFLDVAKYSGVAGINHWYDPALWHRSKQEIHPDAAPIFGEYAARLLASSCGKSSKCLVLDLDNTLWGGVIGDDGLGGITLGQGSADGEAYLDFQKYLLAQRSRGVVLAICSKNDHQTALDAIDNHPEMLIRSKDITCFIANWENKADNLRRIAKELNIGTDALLFIDDNPAERALIRRELPEVAVPELPEDPAYYPDWIGQSGYLEAVAVTREDAQRADQYAANHQRVKLMEMSTSVDDYLQSLEMTLEWGLVDRTSTTRAVQLANKTNQFNLTSKRYSDADMLAMIEDSDWMVIQARMKDKFGDSGIITVAALRFDQQVATIDNWVMSCRVFDREIEQEMIALFAHVARNRGCRTIHGTYIPTQKNGVVEHLYRRMGFELAGMAERGSNWALSLSNFAPQPTKIAVMKIS